MKIVIFVHAIGSCWNNDSSHFLRGVATELERYGHEVLFCEPRHSWSEDNLIRDHGAAPLERFRQTFPSLKVIKYSPEAPDLDRLTDGAHLVLVHEWNSASLVGALGHKRRNGAPFVLLFHDTHRRQLSDNKGRVELGDYDAVLTRGTVLAEQYRKRRAANRVWIWHEAADTSLFFPRATNRTEGDLVWVGQWGDEERTAELEELMFRPIEALGLFANLYGVRYPENAVHELAARGIAYRGWLANHELPEVFARHRLTVHVPSRRPGQTLAGIPGIRVLEALACGIPLITSRWDDIEKLLPKGSFLMARNGNEMQRLLRDVLADPALARSLRESGLKAIQERHSCRHRVQELLEIYSSIKLAAAMTSNTDAARCASSAPEQVRFQPVRTKPQTTTAAT